MRRSPSRTWSSDARRGSTSPRGPRSAPQRRGASARERVVIPHLVVRFVVASVPGLCSRPRQGLGSKEDWNVAFDAVGPGAVVRHELSPAGDDSRLERSAGARTDQAHSTHVATARAYLRRAPSTKPTVGRSVVGQRRATTARAPACYACEGGLERPVAHRECARHRHLHGHDAHRDPRGTERVVLPEEVPPALAHHDRFRQGSCTQRHGLVM